MLSRIVRVVFLLVAVWGWSFPPDWCVPYQQSMFLLPLFVDMRQLLYFIYDTVFRLWASLRKICVVCA